MAVSEYRWRWDAKGMSTVSVACFCQILPEPIRRECHQILLAIPKVDIDLGLLGVVLVPDPARNLVAIRLLDFAHMMRQRRNKIRPEKMSNPKQTKWKVMKTARAFEKGPSRQ